MEATSKAVHARVVGDGLLQLKQRFDRWRAGRKAGKRIPPELWAAAVSLAAESGVYRVAAELRLDYAGLKRRASAAGDQAGGTQVVPRFVEMFSASGPNTPAGTSQPQCVVEMVNARGAKMRVELSGNGLCGLSTLCNAFWAA